MLEGLQADFADQADEQVQLKTQLESAHSQHSELQAAKSSEVASLAQQLAEHQDSAKTLQVSNSCAQCQKSPIASGGDWSCCEQHKCATVPRRLQHSLPIRVVMRTEQCEIFEQSGVMQDA